MRSLSITLALAAPAAAQDEAAPPPRPNIVFVLADDLGYGDPGYLNAESKIPTPRLDALAGEGLSFLDAHSPSAVCSPTRYGILTGRYAWRGKLQRGVVLDWEPPVLEDERSTLPEMLRDAGYATHAIGKWHLGWDWPWVDGRHGGSVDFEKPLGGGPLAHGFDTFFGQDVPHFPPYAWIEDDRLTAIPTGRTPRDFWGTPGPMVPDWDAEAVLPAITARAVRTIEEHAAREEREPFFLWFALTAPHTPLVPTEAYRGKSGAGIYGDFVCQVDAVVGEIVDALERTGLAEETLLVFASDNGSPGRTSDAADVGTIPPRFGHDPSGGWRGLKADIWEGGHRVPLIVRWPGRVAADASTSEPVCLVDWMATIASILGLELPDDAAEDSFDLSPLLFDRRYEAPLRPAIVHQSFHGMLAIREGDWKLAFGLGSGGWSEPVWLPPEKDGPPGQLYDLGADPAEAQNLFLEQKEVAARLEEKIRAIVLEGRSRPRRSASREKREGDSP